MAYTAIVLDASAAFALLLVEEEGAEIEGILNETISVNGQIFVPALFWYELGNGLLMAERKKRITPQATSEAVSNFAQLPLVIDQDTDPAISDRILSLARKNNLTYYDACYLELALRLNVPLKSYDPHLLDLKASFPLIL